MALLNHGSSVWNVGNILITDLLRNNIKIFSPYGQLIHTIGKAGQRRGELHHPYVRYLYISVREYSGVSQNGHSEKRTTPLQRTNLVERN